MIIIFECSDYLPGLLIKISIVVRVISVIISMFAISKIIFLRHTVFPRPINILNKLCYLLIFYYFYSYYNYYCCVSLFDYLLKQLCTKWILLIVSYYDCQRFVILILYWHNGIWYNIYRHWCGLVQPL